GGPACEYSNGDVEWYINDLLHREDGPAIEHVEGYKAWYKNDKLHREDGPAIEHSSGNKLWYNHDVLYKLNDHNMVNNKCERCELFAKEYGYKLGQDWLYYEDKIIPNCEEFNMLKVLG